jgi:hypothetical protein
VLLFLQQLVTMPSDHGVCATRVIDDVIKCPRLTSPQTKSLGCSISWTMRNLDDAALGRREPLDMGSLRRRDPWT